MVKIKFGTSGWRAKIADEFTFENVRIMAQAIVNYIKEEKISDKGIVIGYDNRFLSPEFAHECAKVFAGNKIKVYLSSEAIPTPAVSYFISNFKTAGSINITASHNPGLDNGLKYNSQDGGPASKEVTNRITQFVEQIQKDTVINTTEDESLIEKFNPKEAFTKRVLELVDSEVIKKSRPTIVVNPLYGAGIGYTGEILESLGCNVVYVNNYRDTLFGGLTPDVSKSNMEKMIPIMKEHNALLGVATDGDADRFGIVDSEGNFISPNQVLYLLMHYLINTRGWKTCVGRTVATTYMLDRLGEKYGVEVVETPVGFKYFEDLFLNKEAFICGEESGGLSIKGHVPEKDGILACLLMVEMVTRLGKSPTQIMEDIKSEVGYLYSDRLDIHTSNSEKERILKALKSYSPTVIGGQKVKARNDIDGTKFVMEDGSWVLVRASGTEAVFRIYAEGNTEEQIKEIHKQVLKDLELK